jgi:hypothetical protein
MSAVRARCGFLLALGAALWAGCRGEDAMQEVTGHFATTTTATAVRGLDGDTAIAAAPVRRDGSFVVALPSGGRYRLEVLIGGEVKQLVARNGTALEALAFKVCRPTATWNVGDITSPSTSPGTCDPAKDPSCGKCTDPKDPTCGGGGGGGSGGCDPATDPSCGKCTDPKEPGCPPVCEDPTGANCSPPPLECADPTDPIACKTEICAADPAHCGCPSNDPDCWHAPGNEVCDAAGNCAADRALAAEHPPVDFGCAGSD